MTEDMSLVIIPKSDQLNADDLITGPRTITITKVAIRPGTEQPVTISYEGDGGRPYKPCKSMCRVMADPRTWGPDAKQYVGRSLTLYRDPTVTWAGLEVGGIRISHMSHIDRGQTMALTVTNRSRKPYIVKPLAQRPAQEAPPPSRKAAPASNAGYSQAFQIDVPEDPAQEAPPQTDRPHEPAESRADPEETRAAGHFADEVQDAMRQEWTPETAKARAKELIEQFGDHGNKRSTLDDTWSFYSDEIATMPAPVQQHLVRAYDKVRDGLPEDEQTGRVEDERQGDLA